MTLPTQSVARVGVWGRAPSGFGSSFAQASRASDWQFRLQFALHRDRIRIHWYHARGMAVAARGRGRGRGAAAPSRGRGAARGGRIVNAIVRAGGKEGEASQKQRASMAALKRKVRSCISTGLR